MPRSDASRGYAPAPAGDRPRLFDLMLPWAAGILVTLIAELGVAVVVWDWVAGDDPSNVASPARTILFLHLPSAVCIALGTWAAAALHRSPSRDSRVRHGLAAFAPAVALQLVIYVSQGGDLTVITFLVQLAVLLVGCAVGFLADRLRNG
ncbi:hypothetical protein EES39_06910 [Streptomyces sp. ADI92-24]|uniref:hypothetical protein n=1 Tax=unclassified Streptomyces TaxID=2593676 RepID=UPI000F4612B0|nr:MULTISPECIES: hypothetical protein [unclassified Streptomyces]MCX4772136.1 hypothetical protein [Streptomyces sp. NBC_01285]ROQ80557.1 hypothetical protein EDD95_0078 [Streptomyces sp. CEV 2-1]RPK49992.1 hypothetical protein EES39_06910 [Streptomyces sp. ADI92-24]